MRTLITERLARLSALGSPEAGAGLREAAVLVPLIEHPSGLTVLLAQRTQHLQHHPGQISLPGGGIEPGDADAVAAALRETEEEVGIPPERVEVIGRLEPLVTITRFRVTPVVGFVRPGFELRLDPYEVEDAFEVPLEFFLDPANRELRTRRVGQRDISYYVMQYRDRTIWGATARILINFADKLTGDEPR
jgi:8-oxo-dGTP pyrophosphatase MutT (NUDIX family)